MSEQTTMLADEQTPVAPDPIEFHSRRHVHLTVQALDDRAAVIDKLAKSTEAEGYHRISRELKADAEMIRQDILPQIREQQEIPLAGPDEGKGAIRAYLWPSLRRALKSKENDEAMLDRLAARLEPLLTQVYRQGLGMGLALREDNPDLAIVRACFHAANDQATPV